MELIYGYIKKGNKRKVYMEMEYKDCKVLCDVKHSDEPLTSKVIVDDCITMVKNNFDYDFDGESKFYPFVLPKEVIQLMVNKEVSSIVVCGASGCGKSTMLKPLIDRIKPLKQWDNTKAIVSNFDSKEEAADKLSAVGLSSMPVWCRPRNVLSVGEGFRADVALNIRSMTIFDEFTSTIDRNVAKSTCNSLHKYIDKHNLKNVIFCSCHKDYIPYLKPDIVIDLDLEKVFDCRGCDLGKELPYTSMKQITKMRGAYLGDIII